MTKLMHHNFDSHATVCERTWYDNASHEVEINALNELDSSDGFYYALIVE